MQEMKEIDKLREVITDLHAWQRQLEVVVHLLKQISEIGESAKKLAEAIEKELK